jgi:hypothetical protein
MYLAMQHGYEWTLYALCVLILISGEGRMKRTVLTLVAVMLAAWWLSPLWPTEAYAWAMIGIDSAALVTICWHPAGRWQSIVGLTYVIQVAVHFGRIIVGDATDRNGYWWGLSLSAIVQLLLLGGWWFVERFLRPRGLDSDPAPAHPGHAGMVR